MFKKVGKIILLVVIFAAGAAAGLVVKYYIDDWRAKRNVALWMESFEAPYKNDKYGGATPEETFDLYLAALKKGDLKLASRYFIINMQEKEVGSLENKKNRGEFQSYIEKLDNAKNIWTKKQDDYFNWVDRAAFEYKTSVIKTEYIDFKDPKTGQIEKIKVPPGEYKELIQFEKINNFWKLYLL